MFVGVEQVCPRRRARLRHWRPEEKAKPVWWVKIRLPGGAVGWSNEPDRFGNKDSCG